MGRGVKVMERLVVMVMGLPLRVVMVTRLLEMEMVWLVEALCLACKPTTWCQQEGHEQEAEWGRSTTV